MYNIVLYYNSDMSSLPTIDIYHRFTEIHSIMSRDNFYKVYDDIVSTYESVPYHSMSHGNDVMLVGYTLLKNSKIVQYLNKYEILTFLFGMLGHDAAHPGIGSKTKIDEIRERFRHSKSPLEEYHYTKTSDILKKHHVGHYDEFLRHIILATDPFLPVEDAEIGLRSNIKDIVKIIKMADVNHAIGSFDKHLEWTWKLENELGFKLSPKSQIQFLETHLIPLVRSSETVLSDYVYRCSINNLHENIDFWKRKLRT